jgi:hypothetical protein
MHVYMKRVSGLMVEWRYMIYNAEMTLLIIPLHRVYTVRNRTRYPNHSTSSRPILHTLSKLPRPKLPLIFPPLIHHITNDNQRNQDQTYISAPPHTILTSNHSKTDGQGLHLLTRSRCLSSGAEDGVDVRY